jgi:hypothetical protein
MDTIIAYRVKSGKLQFVMDQRPARQQFRRRLAVEPQIAGEIHPRARCGDSGDSTGGGCEPWPPEDRRSPPESQC